jgi:hypothetical protein
LIGTDDEGFVVTFSYQPCLRIGERERAVSRRTAVSLETVLDERLVNASGFNPDADACCCEQPSASRTG